jgi:hypothetical protein
MKLALVSDLVLANLDDEYDDWLTNLPHAESMWTWHLGRQLGFTSAFGRGGLHHTLLLLVVELNIVLKEWPPRHDPAICISLAREATKHLDNLEVCATLLAGQHWRGTKVTVDCKVEVLGKRLRPILEKALAAELGQLLARWEEWDVRSLIERRKEAVVAAEAARAKAPPAAVDIDLRQPRERLSGRDRADWFAPSYVPPAEPRYQ